MYSLSARVHPAPARAAAGYDYSSLYRRANAITGGRWRAELRGTHQPGPHRSRSSDNHDGRPYRVQPGPSRSVPGAVFPQNKSCKHPLTVAMKSTKCSVRKHAHYTKDSRLQDTSAVAEPRIYTWTHWIRMQPNHPHPGKSVVDVASRRTYTAHRAGGELTTRGLEPAKSRAGPGAYDGRAQGCKIHGCRSRLSPLVSQVLIRYPIELYKAQNFQNRTYSKPHTRLTRVEKDHVLGPAEKDTTRPTIVYRGRRPWHLLPNCANQFGMA